MNGCHFEVDVAPWQHLFHEANRFMGFIGKTKHTLNLSRPNHFVPSASNLVPLGFTSGEYGTDQFIHWRALDDCR